MSYVYMDIQPTYETPGLLDIELGGDDYHFLFIKKVGLQSILAQSERDFPVGQINTYRFTLPVLDWVFQVEGKVIECQKIGDVMDDPKFNLLISFESMETQDQKQLEAFIEMHKAGKTQIKDIM